MYVRILGLMKIFCFIFSFYLLLLSTQPCQDLAAGGDTFLQMENKQILPREDGKPQTENHECSPFCICSCRQMSISYNYTALARTELAAITIRKISKARTQDNYTDQHLDTIWQPPKFNFAV
jgi:hypothetical protein